MAVLLWVENFEQSGSGIALVVVPDLIYFVEHQHGICHSGPLHSIDYAAGHRTYICTPVTSDLSFVVQAAERHSLVFPAQSLRHRFSDRCLADTRRAYKA